MIELNSKYGTVKIFAKTVEEEALGQITKMANSVLRRKRSYKDNARLPPE